MAIESSIAAPSEKWECEIRMRGDALRAHKRPATNSCTRFETARPTYTASAGSSRVGSLAYSRFVKMRH